jgi:hypothetical protein
MDKCRYFEVRANKPDTVHCMQTNRSIIAPTSVISVDNSRITVTSFSSFLFVVRRTYHCPTIWVCEFFFRNTFKMVWIGCDRAWRIMNDGRRNEMDNYVSGLYCTLDGM